MLDDNEKFGVVMILPEVCFSTELRRDSIPEMMESIDKKLTEQGAPEETILRCAMMMNNALSVSQLMAMKKIEQTSGIPDMAYSFIYAFGKQVGFDQMDIIRGITGSCIGDILNLNPCLGDEEYKQQSRYLVTKMNEHEERNDDVWDYSISFGPTIH